MVQMPPWKRGRISQFMTVTSSRKYILAWVGRLSDEITSLLTPTGPNFGKSPWHYKQAAVSTFTAKVITRDFIFCLPENKMEKSNSKFNHCLQGFRGLIKPFRQLPDCHPVLCHRTGKGKISVSNYTENSGVQGS